jgi:hypothetical protein
MRLGARRWRAAAPCIRIDLPRVLQYCALRAPCRGTRLFALRTIVQTAILYNGQVSVPTRTYWLSMHVPYVCQHSGACCTSHWPIPIERARVAAIAALRPKGEWLQRVEHAPREIAGVLARTANGHCVFHRDGCEIQRAYGHDAIPSACQHFPRQILVDARGVFVSLSHYCPTAADLLFRHEGPVAIVEGPPALPSGEPEGLDARDALPPLLRAGARSDGARADGARARSRQMGPGLDKRGQVLTPPLPVLMDGKGSSAWEAHVVKVLTTGDGPPELALSQLESDLAELQRWSPGDGTLAEAVGRLAEPVSRPSPQGHQRVRPDVDADAIIRRYLAARGFAAWDAYGPQGIAGVLDLLRRALAMLRTLEQRVPLKSAIRQTDLQLLHLSHRHGLAQV